MATSLLRPHAVAAGLGGRNAPIDKKPSFGAKKLVTKKIRDSSMKFRHGVRVTVAAASQLVGAAFSVALGIPLALQSGGLKAALGSLQGGPVTAWTTVVGVAALSAAAYTLTAKVRPVTRTYSQVPITCLPRYVTRPVS